jgi:hypothetical protein
MGRAGAAIASRSLGARQGVDAVDLVRDAGALFAVAARGHALEAVQRVGHLTLEQLGGHFVRLGPDKLSLDLVRRPFPRPVEPVDEGIDLRSVRSGWRVITRTLSVSGGLGK